MVITIPRDFYDKYVLEYFPHAEDLAIKGYPS